jgi:predicted PolB exonuclease-like 3'-5' exonuclease
VSRFLLFDLETSGLSPLHDKISCICCKVFGEDSSVCFSGDFEGRILEDFTQFVGQQDIDFIVAYNGWLFDVPFLRVRAMVNKVKLPSVFWVDSKLIDPYNILTRSKHGKQSEFAKLLGYDVIGNGLECLSLLEKGDFESIEKHCSSDIVALEKIFGAMLDSGFVK